MKTTLATTLFLILATLISVPAARAEGPDAQTRYHDAYVLEIVEGKIAEAARVYMSLMNDEQVPGRLRAESRFRFAICAVLLGRADEGRRQLELLVADTTAPAAVRDRAQKYMSTVAGIGVGTELDKKLQALVFDLGRVPANVISPPVYRDFEIIGKSSLPFLRKLLRHSDKKIRQHAFRILARMDDPGLAQRWTQDLWTINAKEFISYLMRHTPELAAFEKRVMELGTPAYQQVRYMPLIHPSSKRLLSMEFIRAFAATGIRPATATGLLGGGLDDEGFDQLVAWMDGADEELADSATDWLLRYGTGHEKADVAFFRELLAHMMVRLADDKTRIKDQGLAGLIQLAIRFPLDVSLDALALLIEDVETHGGLLQTRRAARALLEPIASSLNRQNPTPEQAERHASLLMRWLAFAEASDVAQRKAGEAATHLSTDTFAHHMRYALAGLDEPRAAAYVKRLLSAPGRSSNNIWARLLMPMKDARTVRLLTTAIKATPPGRLRQTLFQVLNIVPKKPLPPAFNEAIDNARLALLDPVDDKEIGALLARYPQVVGKRPSATVRLQVFRLLEKSRALDSAKRKAVHAQLLRGHAEFFTKILAPLAQARWGDLSALERERMLAGALRWVDPNTGSAETRDAAAEVLRPHLAEIDPNRIFTLRADPERYPIATWLHRVPDRHATWLAQHMIQPPAGEADAVAEAITAKGKPINEAVLRFVLRFVSPAKQASIFDGALASLDANRRTVTLGMLDPSGRPASTKALQALVTRELEATPIDMGRLRGAGSRLLKRKPSAKLFPVARALLASKAREDIVAGIQMADSLGQQDLVPALTPHLGSMDSHVRLLAKKAVASIRAIAQIQAEEVLRKSGRR